MINGLMSRVAEDRPLFKEIVDLSMELKSMDTPVFPGTPQPLKATIQTVKEDGYLSYIWSFSEHTATHIDAPAHMVEGRETIEKIPRGTSSATDWSSISPKSQSGTR